MIPKLVSVIIPTYNRPHYLPESVASVLSQTYPFIEIIIVDDGSAEGGSMTREVLKPYLSQTFSKSLIKRKPNASSDFPQVTYIYQENRGVSYAVNQGLAMARGEYIQRLDDDDRLLPEKIARSVEVFQTHPEVGLVATGFYHIDAEGNRIHRGSPCPCPGPARLLNMLMRCVSAQAGVMVRSIVHQKVGVYRTDIVYGEDYEMWVRIAQAYDIETINEPLVEYRRHSENATVIGNPAKMEEDLIGFISEYLRSTPLDTLIPNLQSKPYGYALRAAVYLQKDGEYVRSTPLARRELESAFQLLPGDALLSLWKGMLAIFECENFPSPLWHESLPAAYQPTAKELTRLFDEQRRLIATEADPSSPEMVAFREQFVSVFSGLIQQTYRKATGRMD